MLKAILPTATHVIVACSVHLSVGMSSVTLVHPAKGVGKNEMPFGTDTRVVPSNTVLDRGPILHGKGRLGSESLVRSDSGYCQFILALVTVYTDNHTSTPSPCYRPGHRALPVPVADRQTSD